MSTRILAAGCALWLTACGGAGSGGAAATGAGSGAGAAGAIAGAASPPAAGSGGSAGRAAVGGSSGAAGSAGANGGAGAGGSAGAGAGGAGGAGGGAAAAGSGGSAGAAGSAGQAALVPPIERQGKYVLEFGELLFEIDPQLGARITKCQIAGQNLLSGPDVDSVNFGSTFWPSPQQRWNWPPVPEIDNQPYTGSVAGDSVTLVSGVGQRAKVKVSKRFTARPSEGALDIEYSLSNEDSTPVYWAPWEITRVAARGITFFPTGEQSVNTQLALTQQGAISWYRHDPSTLAQGGQKFTGDGSKGWLAHVAGDKLLLKRWADVPIVMQAPAPEAEVEIYAAFGYVELEPQGPYTQLMPGQSLSWQVRWYVRRLPAGAMPAVGSSELVSFAESLASSQP